MIVVVLAVHVPPSAGVSLDNGLDIVKGENAHTAGPCNSQNSVAKTSGFPVV